jgi:D-arabinose 1-dehydrogenase-like Zn-dependent alcohol dehydrogenase
MRSAASVDRTDVVTLMSDSVSEEEPGATHERSDMRVLVTGGRGKVGSHAVAVLQAARHRVTVIDLAPPRYGMRRPGEPAYVRADLTDYGATIATVMESRAEAVVHTVGFPDPIHDAGQSCSARTRSSTTT